MLLRSTVAWCVIALAETLHGIVRIRFLNRRLGDRRARQVGVLSGSVIIVSIGWFILPWIGVNSVRECIVVGSLWTILMLTFDLAFGRFYLGLPWRRVAADFDVTKGGFLGLGMIVLFCTPLLVAKLRGLV